MSDLLKPVGIFYTLGTSFIAGVFLYSFGATGIAIPVALFLGALVSLLVLIVWKKIEAIIFLCIFSACMLGCARMLLVPDVSLSFVHFDRERVVLEGVVVADVDRRDTSAHLTVEVLRINDEPVEGVVRVTTDRTTTISYADTLKVQGVLELPKPFETDTGKEFDYPGYLRAQGIGAVMLYPTITPVAHEEVTFFGALYGLKHMFERSLERVIPEPAAGLLKGILLGNKAALGDALYALFITAGLVHVVVLSGYNLTIVADGLMRLCSRFREKGAFAVGSAGIILFALMVGGDAVVVRASIMALIVIAGRVFKRPTIAMRSLLFACVVMVALNPLILTHDPSFILSFLAAFGLITFAPIFERWFSFLPKTADIRGVVSATLATQAFLFPALIFYTGALSLVALPANLLALPLIPYTMLLGFLTGVLALIHPWLAFLLMIPTWGLLSLIMSIASSAASIPMASISVVSLQTPYVFGLYALLVPLALYSYKRITKTPA